LESLLHWSSNERWSSNCTWSLEIAGVRRPFKDSNNVTCACFELRRNSLFLSERHMLSYLNSFKIYSGENCDVSSLLSACDMGQGPLMIGPSFVKPLSPTKHLYIVSVTTFVGPENLRLRRHIFSRTSGRM